MVEEVITITIEGGKPETTSNIISHVMKALAQADYWVSVKDKLIIVEKPN